MMPCHFHLFYIADCGPPPQIANGNAELLRSGALSAALYSCDFGYTLVGTSSALAMPMRRGASLQFTSKYNKGKF